jgi:hypothetical protein
MHNSIHEPMKEFRSPGSLLDKKPVKICFVFAADNKTSLVRTHTIEISEMICTID